MGKNPRKPRTVVSRAAVWRWLEDEGATLPTPRGRPRAGEDRLGPALARHFGVTTRTARSLIAAHRQRQERMHADQLGINHDDPGVRMGLAMMAQYMRVFPNAEKGGAGEPISHRPHRRAPMTLPPKASAVLVQLVEAIQDKPTIDALTRALEGRGGREARPGAAGPTAHGPIQPVDLCASIEEAAQAMQAGSDPALRSLATAILQTVQRHQRRPPPA